MTQRRPLIVQQEKLLRSAVSDYIDRIVDGCGLRQRVITQPRPQADIGTHSSRLYALECIPIERLTLAATAAVVRGRDVEAPRRSEGAKERDQIALLLAGQFRAEHQIEELNRIIEGQQAPVVHVGR